MITLLVGGGSYDYPEEGNNSWATDVTIWATAVSAVLANLSYAGARGSEKYTFDNTVWVDIKTAILLATSGIRNKYAASNAGGSIPTATALISAFGAANAVGSGYGGFYKNTNAGDGKVYVVVSDGTNYHYGALTQAT